MVAQTKGLRRRSKFGEGTIGGDSWSSYSDLIAAVLLIFIFVGVLKDYQIERMVAEPADVLKSWQNALQELCEDADLKSQGLTPDCTTGTIELPDRVFFGFNETELLDEGKETLRTAIPIVLDKLRAQQAVWSRLNVEVRGHADPRVRASSGADDSYEINLDKSARRAETVLLFLTTDPSFSAENRIDVRRLAVASGASDSQPPAGCETLPENECYDRMRRVEIQLRLDDREIRQALIQLLDRLQNDGARKGGDGVVG